MSDTVTPCSSPESRQFDFWLGDWDLSWPAEQSGGQSGDTAHGTNRIERLLGDCVIAETFATADGTFKGRSLSAFDTRDGTWRQTWVDNMGSYLTFAGSYDGETMELRAQEIERDGSRTVQRMIFSDIEPDSLSWDWQDSLDGGQTWKSVWSITYRRRRQS
jgi:hypothetical protein